MGLIFGICNNYDNYCLLRYIEFIKTWFIKYNKIYTNKYLINIYYLISSATFFAELVRSGIDAINHLIIFSANFINVRPTKEYPYGLDKIKNIIVMIPASLFLVCGGETIFHSFRDFFANEGLNIN